MACPRLHGLLLAVAACVVVACGGEPTAVDPPVASDPEVPAAREVPWLGPHGGAVFPLGDGSACLEYTHSEHWGFASVYLLDAEGNDRPFDEPPVLSVFCDGESLQLEPGRGNWDEVEDGGWHFEDDALLGVPERGRLRVRVDGLTYAHPFEHIHLSAHGGHAHQHAAEHATGPHVHGPGPHGGIVITIPPHRAHVEVVHNGHWGIAAIYLFDAAMEPKTFDVPPVLNIRIEDVPFQLTAARENWEGEEDEGWHFEDDALLGMPDPGRFRLVIDGLTWTPDLVVGSLTHEEGHSHGHEADDHSKCDPRLCEFARAAAESSQP